MAKFYVKKDAEGKEIDRKPVKRGRPPKGYVMVDDAGNVIEKEVAPAPVVVDTTAVATPEVSDTKEVADAEKVETTEEKEESI